MRWTGWSGRVLQLIAAGTMEADDLALIDAPRRLKAQRRADEEEFQRLMQRRNGASKAITAVRPERFAGVLRKALASDDHALRRANLRLFVAHVTVCDDEIRIVDPTPAPAPAQ